MSTTRRKFLGQLRDGTAVGAVLMTGCAHGPPPVGTKPLVMTVLGPIPPEQMGVTLAHEHVLVDFIGAEEVSPARYEAEEVYRTTLPHLEALKDLGCQTFVDCTPAYVGRNPVLLQRLATATGLQILTNTGYYGASRSKYLPRHALEESSDQLAVRWLREWREGIEGTGIRPGLIKIGVDSGKLPEQHRKLIRAAALTHLSSGLTIASHSGNGIAAVDQLATLWEEGVAASAFIWVHAQNEPDLTLHTIAAEMGAWIELDGISPASVDRHVELITTLHKNRLLNRILLSHDAGWYHVGEANGGEFRSYSTLFTELVPALQQAGLTPGNLHQLLVENPRQAFTVRVRKA